MLQQLRRAIRRAARPGHRGVEQGQDFYDRRYQTKASKRLPYHLSHYYALWSVIADRVRSHTGVLEVGCGAGQLAALMREQGLERYTGFDLSPAAVEIARSQCPEGDFRVANAFETELFDTAEYDTLICTEVLEHVDRDLDLIGRWPAGVHCVCSAQRCPGPSGHVGIHHGRGTKLGLSSSACNVISLRHHTLRPGWAAAPDRAGRTEETSVDDSRA